MRTITLYSKTSAESSRFFPWQTEKPAGVLLCQPVQFSGRYAPDFGHATGRLCDVGRLVSLSAPRLRGEIGGIGFDEKPIRRDITDNGPERLGLPIGHGTRHGKEKTHIDTLPGHGRIPGKAVENPAQTASFPADDAEGVRMGVPIVDDHGEVQFHSKIELRGEMAELGLSGGVVVEVIETDLPDGNDLAMLRELAEGVIRGGVDPLCLMGVYAYGSINQRVAFRDFHRLEAVGNGRSDGDDRRQSRGPGPGDDGVPVGVKCIHFQMRMAVDHCVSPFKSSRTVLTMGLTLSSSDFSEDSMPRAASRDRSGQAKRTMHSTPERPPQPRNAGPRFMVNLLSFIHRICYIADSITIRIYRRSAMNLRQKMTDLSMEGKGLYYRLSIIFSLFFFVPLLGLLYFGLKYGILEDRFLPAYVLALLVSSLAGYVLIRRVFDAIRNTSKRISDTLSKDIAGFTQPTSSDELQGIVQSFRTVENELRNSFCNLEKRTQQLTTLKELSDLCYVTFDSRDLFAITLERALKLTNSDVGSVLILEGKKRETFVVHATYGLGDLVKIGDRVDFATSIAKFAVINKSPLVIGDIETDSRFGRGNRPHYATKSFLCMPLKGIQEVFGVLTLSRRAANIPYSPEDTDALTPLLSNAAFTYDNLELMETNRRNHRHLAIVVGLCQTLGSSLRNGELLHALLNQCREEIPFDLAVILDARKETPDLAGVLDIFSPVPIGLEWNGTYNYAGSCLEGVVRQGNLLAVDQPAALQHPIERELFVKPGIQDALLAPLKIGGTVMGILVLGAFRPGALSGFEDQVQEIAYPLSLAIEKNRLASSVSRRDQELASIQQIGSILAASTFDRQEVLRHTMEMIQNLVNVEAGSLLLLDGDELALTFKVFFNDDPAIDATRLDGFRVHMGRGIAGYCAARGEPIVVRDVRTSRHFDSDFDRQTGFRTRSVLCVPVISRGKVLGVIEVLNKISGDFNDDDLHLLQSIATSVSIALENSKLYGETVSMAEHERGIRKMFQKFVPREIVDKIIHNVGEEKPLIEELKILTLLNIDIRGFSTLSKKIGPQRTVALLNRFFSAMGEIVFNHGGIVDKYLGDGFLALFGAPIAGKTDADNAIAAALEMKESLQEVNNRVAGEVDAPLKMGISIHTGEAVVGNIGFEKKMDYTVIGDSVNAVFRLQDLTRSHPNGILISEKTLQAVVDSVLDVRDIGKCDTGGALGELRIYELLGRKARCENVS